VSINASAQGMCMNQIQVIKCLYNRYESSNSVHEIYTSVKQLHLFFDAVVLYPMTNDLIKVVDIIMKVT